ncbi:MAG: carbon starvation protein A [Candidatus Magnetoovum sp. WYHC-5]|nr:carbon starvation protein A [Candidatus Magnetoovum sp. WYHC-5]
MIVFVVLVSILIFIIGYIGYGTFIFKQTNLDDSCATPACAINDGVDYVPAKPFLLLGQHFSAIAAAGPIVGPILAGIWFGWLPALLWIIVGAIFIGGVHDFFSLTASLKHRASSIGEIIKENMSSRSHVLFLIFVFFALEYVIIAFTDITAQTFKFTMDNTPFGPGVAASSCLYLLASVVMGIMLYKYKFNLATLTIIFLPIVLLIIWIGPRLPQPLITLLSSVSVKKWDTILLIYCYVASVIPVWLLLQPRGYLGGWLLYLTLIVGLIGALFGGFKIEYPAFNLEGLQSLTNGKLMFPLLFITVACGACSGFHAIVSSGTTSKQLDKESSARIIGYGTMLLEGVVAVLALATVMMLPKGDEMLKGDPNLIYANGIAKYIGLFGIGFKAAFPFALLAFSTFVYDTLDVCTRLARYVLQELLGWKSKKSGYIATFITLALPFMFLMLTKEKGYISAWPIFGTSNQLLASLTLLAISVWLIKGGKRAFYTVLPMLFMLIVTTWSLLLQIIAFIKVLPDVFAGVTVKSDIVISGVVGIILMASSLFFVKEVFVTLKSRK